MLLKNLSVKVLVVFLLSFQFLCLKSLNLSKGVTSRERNKGSLHRCAQFTDVHKRKLRIKTDQKIEILSHCRVLMSPMRKK